MKKVWFKDYCLLDYVLLKEKVAERAKRTERVDCVVMARYVMRFKN